MAFPKTLTSTELAPPQQGDVVDRTAVCPLLTRTADAAETVTVLSAPAPADGTGGGEVLGGPTGPQPLPASGTSTAITPDQDGTSITVRMTGDKAASTATVRTYFDGGDEGRGLALADCATPRSQWWFVGVSAMQGQIDQLLLANPTSTPAVVSLDVFGPAGPIDVVGASGLVVPPDSQSVIRVDSLIPGVSSAALRVSTSGGLVAAALLSTAIDGLIPQGAEFIPAAIAPARTVVLPAALAGPGPRRLLITGGPRDAAVRVTLLTGSGSSAVEGPQIAVPAGTTVAVDLADELGQNAAAVLLEGSAPVTAGLQSVVKGTLAEGATGVLNRVPVADYAWTAAAQPIADRRVLPLSGVAGAPGGLLLSSIGGPATARVEARAANGAATSVTVELGGDSAQEVSVPVVEGQATTVEVAVEGEGEVYAASYQVGALPTGPLATAAIGLDPSTEVTVPLAYPDPQVLSGS
jgi:hypothetical protein